MVNNDIRIFLRRSKLRLEVLKELNEKPQIAIFLSEKLNKHREVISRIFLDLKKQGLAECINEKDPHFRKYKLTRKGRGILKKLE